MFNKAEDVKINDMGLSAVNEVGKLITNDAMRTAPDIIKHQGGSL